MRNKLTNLMALAAVGCTCLLGAGCSRRSYEWKAERKPETPEERAAVERETVAILAATPIQKLEGHDQDWDDAIATAHRCAIQTQCKTRLYEWLYIGFPEGRWEQTGRMSEVSDRRP